MVRLHPALKLFVLVLLISAAAEGFAQTPFELPVTDTERFDDLDAVIQAPGTGSLPFGNGEFVSMFNGNLHVTHPSSTSLPMDGGGVLAFGRQYNSVNVRYYRAWTASGWKNLLAGPTWVGLGWNAHFGRVFEKAVWDPTTSSYNDDLSELFFEFPDGSLHKFSPEVNVAQPNLDISFAWRCDNFETTCPKPTQPDLCRDHCTDTTPYYDVVFPGGGGVHLEKVVTFGKDGSWINKPWRSGYYATSVGDGKGNSIAIEYWSDPNFPEAVKSVTWSQYPDAKIETTICGSVDVGPGLPCVASGLGMLKSVTSIGFQGSRATPQRMVHRYWYSEIQLPDGGVNVMVPILTRVDVVGVEDSLETPAGSIEYEYGAGLTLSSPPAGSPALLDRISYPLGAVSEFGYDAWAAGRRRVGSTDSDRLSVSVTRRVLFPDGLPPTPSTSGVARASWSIARRFSFVAGVTGCDAVKADAERWVAVTGPDGLQSRMDLTGHPCGIDDESHDWGPYGLPEKVVALNADGQTSIRTTRFEYDYSRGTQDGRILRPLLRQVDASFDDDDGTCFDGSFSGSPQKMSTYFRQKDPYNYWKLSYSEGDYVRKAGGLPTRRITYRNYKTPAELSCPESTFSVGLFDYAFVEESDQDYAQVGASDKRVELNYLVSCNGLTSEVRAKDEFTNATTNPNVGTVTPNAAADYDDLETAWQYDHGNVSQVTRSGADRATTFTTSHTWHRGLRVTDVDAANTVSRQADIGGRLSSSTDANNQTTTYNFDSLGRPTIVDPPGVLEFSTRYAYPDFWHSRVIRSAGGATDLDPTDATQEISESETNGLGQVVSTWSVLPNGTKSLRLFRYDGLGRLVFESADMTEAEFNAAPKVSPAWTGWDADGESGPDWTIEDVPTKDGRPWGTLYFYGAPDPSAPTNPLRLSARDPLGRAARVEQADAEYATTAYCGPHTRTDVSDVRVSLTEPQLAVSRTTQYYDGYGRLVLVDAPAGSADAEYSYDVNGQLTRVNLFRFPDGVGGALDEFPANAYDLWRNGLVPAGQLRTFGVDAAGRTTSVENPEDGRKELLEFDALGNVLKYQDQKAIDEDYYFVNSYDGVGRLTSVDRRACMVLQGQDCNGFNLIEDWEGEFFLQGGWEEGFIDYSEGTESFSPSSPSDPTGWNLVSYGGCLPKPEGDQRNKGLYFGEDCSYAVGDSRSHAIRHRLTTVRRQHAVSMKYFRDVRNGSGNLDNFEVFVTIPSGTNSVANRRYLLRLDESQYSYPRWIEMLPLRLSDLYTYEEWPANATRNFDLYIVFTKGDSETANLGTGLIVDDVKVGLRPTPVARFVYDSDVCASSAVHPDACYDTEGAGNQYRGHLTEAYSYTVDGRANTWADYNDGHRVVTERRSVFMGLNGRLSAESLKIDWTGQGSPPEWVSIYRYGASGSLFRFGAPFLPGVERPRLYEYATKRGYLDGIMDSDSQWIIEAGASVPALTYEAGGRPTSIRFRNGAQTLVAWDKLGRPASIAARDAGGATLWASGPYSYDGLGSVVAVGSQQYAYDLSGRLVASHDVPQATNSPAGAMYGSSYSYDAFGNMTSRDWSQIQGTPPQPPPLGYVFSGRTFGAVDTENQNRIISPSTFRYDPNGNSIRSAGTSPSEVGSAFDAVNRVTAQFLGDPGAPDAAARVGPAERYFYDAAGLRVAIQDYNRDGAITFTLRDALGRLTSEYRQEPSDEAPLLQREHVYGLGQQLAERRVVGVSMEPSSGGTPPSGSGTTGEESQTYSSAVATFVDPNVNSQSDNQVNAISVARAGTTVTTRWSLHLSTNMKKWSKVNNEKLTTPAGSGGARVSG